MENIMLDETGQKHTDEEYNWAYDGEDGSGSTLFRHETEQSAEYCMEYLDSKGIEYELKEGASMLWVYKENYKAYSYYYTTGRWSPYVQGGYPSVHFKSKGIADFVNRFFSSEPPEIKETLDSVSSFLNTQDIKFIQADNPNELYVYNHTDRKYKYVIGEGSWTPYSKEDEPKATYKSGGIEHFVTKYLRIKKELT